MSKKRWIALVIAVVLLFVSLGFQATTAFRMANLEEVVNLGNGKFNEKVLETGSGAEKIVVLRLNGVIQDTMTGAFNTSGYNHNAFLEMIDEAGKDPSVAGIIVRVNSPGGGVVESDEIHDKIIEVQQENEKPVYVSMGNTAASGGYYIAAPADKVIAHPSTLTGSIGVIMQSYNFSELADQIGVDVNTIKSGEFKDIMSPYRNMTEEEHSILQAMIDELYGNFVQVIADGREMEESTVREIGDGRVYTGAQAQELGLVDELGTLDDTIDMMETDFELNNPQIVEYTQGFGINQFLGVQFQNVFGSGSDLDGMVEMLQQSKSPRAMYLYSE
ncbi:signal peptide peptidase SppA [Oceanobacillus piezotolerans]|uniref:Signal peptide peptidase SppA n=1 Tax=Oceanobacillus piezotolerans TaxID=2448030 RepID=A0A498D3A1_9BACI|nr:signal peptide peptidase SppA [Oceanobacillus piezotolerans]RLL41760.1 signal peptide peptidase SppA [Oceanobacillus piezotolerans]